MPQWGQLNSHSTPPTLCYLQSEIESVSFSYMYFWFWFSKIQHRQARGLHPAVRVRQPLGSCGGSVPALTCDRGWQSQICHDRNSYPCALRAAQQHSDTRINHVDSIPGSRQRIRPFFSSGARGGLGDRDLKIDQVICIVGEAPRGG